jgi:hypothetical protein
MLRYLAEDIDYEQNEGSSRLIFKVNQEPRYDSV